MHNLRRGFTLIELTVVIVIIGVMITLVAVNVESLIPTEKIKADARNIGGVLQMARSQAALYGVNYAVVYDLDKNTFWVLSPRVDKDTVYDAEETAERRRKSFLTGLSQDVEFKDIQLGAGKNASRKSGEVHIEITPLGTASGHVVHLINKKTKQEYSIELNAITALVSYYNGFHEFEEVEDYD